MKLTKKQEQMLEHPLAQVYLASLEQTMYGKGERHGGDATPFFEQSWYHTANVHGRGFLTGQASKKIEEAVMSKEGEAWKQEMLGALVYLGMAIIYDDLNK